MTATPQCSNCLFSFVAPASASSTNNVASRSFAGSRFCNRQAPNAQNTNPSGWLWPLVADDWWCGEGADSATGLSYASLLNGIPGANGSGYGGTSSTSLTITNSGSVSATITANLAYTAGARVRFTSTGSGAWMEGVVTAYTVASGAMTFTADIASGSGTHTDWNVNIAGQPGSIASKGTFTLSAAATTTVADVAVAASSVIVLMPTNAAAGGAIGGASTLPVTAGLYVSARTAGVSFAVSTVNGASAAGTETFAYAILN